MVNVATDLTQSPPPFVLPGHYSWAEFETLESIIRKESKLRMTYLDGVIELRPLGEDHQSISRMIGLLIMLYLFKQNIEFIPVGSATRYSEEKLVSFEPDESYYLGKKKEHPDLAVEVNLRSDGLKKLEKYRRLGIQEVWIWSDNSITIYCLENSQYSIARESQLLPVLDIRLLESCILFPSRLEAIDQFYQRAS